MEKTNKIIVSFSGWVECNPEETSFQYIGEIAANRAVISGTKYMRLSQNEKDNYILECLGQAYTNSLDGELMDLEVKVES